MTFPAIPPADEAPLIEWALWYASHGLAVFPCYGKVPITRRGFLDATADEPQIRSWWRQWPEANIGLPVPDGTVVLDVDPRNGGSDTLHALQQLHGTLPDTLTSLTGGGWAAPVFHRRRRGQKQSPDRRWHRRAGKRRLHYCPAIHPSRDRHALPVGCRLWTRSHGDGATARVARRPDPSAVSAGVCRHARPPGAHSGRQPRNNADAPRGRHATPGRLP